ncbi:PWWP domain [Dillenia turbinata]|uniref:PWWP domain n=1 Tax=Dillenia turbinata TaxID=194707 RepID=A0AAN8V6C8_9MAGN
MEENGVSKTLEAQSLDDGVRVSVVDLVQKKQAVKESEVLAEMNVGKGSAGVSNGKKVLSVECDENAERLGGVVDIVDLVDTEGFSEDDKNEMEKSKENRNEEMEADEAMEAGSVGNDLDRKVEFDGNGVSFDVEIHGTEVGVEEVEPKGVQERASGLVELKLGYDFDEKSGSEENKITMSENGGDPSERITGEVDGEEVEEMGEDASDLEYEFSVGDFVWGKVRSHPWWPGQIYDPSDASEAALKYSQRDRFLVAYFGDRSFAWCYPSQLKPFKEEFETMSKQSNSWNFVCAVKEAVDEIGRQLELEMTCSCVSKENQIELTSARPMAVNAGIKEGVFVPEGSLGELSVSHFSPADFLDYLLYAACHVSYTNNLELTVFKSRLSAFCRAKGGSKLLTFHEPELILGLKDISKNIMGQILVEGDKLSSHVGTEAAEIYQISFAESSEDKLFHTRKQKSVAELMEGAEHVENETEKGVVNGEETKLATIASSSRKKRKKSADKSDDDGSNRSLSSRKKNRKTEPSERPTASARVSCVDEGKSSVVEGSKDAAKEELNRGGSETRERKKSKYLSPPYTNLSREPRSLKPNGEPKADSWEVSNVSQIGERMAKDSGQLIGSPPILKCSGQTFQKRLKGNTVELDTVHTPTPETQKEEQNRLNIDPKETSAPADKVLSDVHSAAVDPVWMKDDEITRKFCSAFRSSIYSDGPNYKMYKKLTAQSGRKRKAAKLKHGSSEKDQTPQSPEGKSKLTKHELKGGKDSKDAKSPNLNESGKVNDGKFSVPAAAILVLTFSPGFSSPPKENLVKIYSQFGQLKESETWVSSDFSSCRVPFVNKDDAEEAFNHSQKVNLFGNAQVSYRLENFLAPAMNDKPEETKLDEASSNLKAGGMKPSEQSASADDTLPIQLIKRNFEMMTLMLDTMGSTLSPEVKSCLEGEIKALLKKSTTEIKYHKQTKEN